MKTSLNLRYSVNAIISLLFLALILPAQAQNEQKSFSFQGYARDFSGAAYSSTNITAQFSISPEGESVEYTEQHSLTTDAYGVFSAQIGSIIPVNFAAIDFSSKKYFMKAEVKIAGGDFVTISDTELLAVPYAKASDNAVNAVNAQVAQNAITSDNGNPVGTVISFAGSSAATGYLVCDGTSVLVANYPDLYAAIGDAWGGDGGTNFNLPDLRGQFMRGLNNGAGVDPQAAARTARNSGGNTGDAVGSYQDHGVSVAQMGNGYNQYGAASGNNFTPILIGGNAMVTNPAPETRPKNAYVLFMIKY